MVHISETNLVANHAIYNKVCDPSQISNALLSFCLL
ncbi:hypothetical protein AB205_0098420 [Aquarana catesbeiana]|uniref:Uncharacterized protein n=1 Tax=Aquarana catesbeiana TaxID=8400 RepID=A0A2G9RX40_AQUCT|nr:hypothetical protein AB205_0098420 [Aquarana catesbeiana]